MHGPLSLWREASILYQVMQNWQVFDKHRQGEKFNTEHKFSLWRQLENLHAQNFLYLWPETKSESKIQLLIS